MKSLTLASIALFAMIFVAGCTNDSSSTTQPTTTQITTTTEVKDTTGEIITGTSTTQTTTTVTTTGTIALADVTKHSTKEDCRTIINGKIYDVTAFFGKHPGGDQNLFRTCGIDATEIFNQKHGNSDKAKNVLEGFEISQ